MTSARTAALLALAATVAGCMSLTGDDPGDYGPVEPGPVVGVARTGEAGGFALHVHGWRHAEPGRAAGGPSRYVIADVSVRAADRAVLATSSFGVADASGVPARHDGVLNDLLPEALPQVFGVAEGAVVRGHVLFVAPREFEPAVLTFTSAGLNGTTVAVPLAAGGADAPLAVEPWPGARPPGEVVGIGSRRVRVEEATIVPGPAYFPGFALIRVNLTYADELGAPEGVRLDFELRGSDGRVYRPSEFTTGPWWDLHEEPFEANRAYTDYTLFEAPVEAAPFEVIYDDGAAAWGPLSPVGLTPTRLWVGVPTPAPPGALP